MLVKLLAEVVESIKKLKEGTLEKAELDNLKARIEKLEKR